MNASNAFRATTESLLVMRGVRVDLLLRDDQVRKVAIAFVAEEQALAPVGDQNDAVVGDLHRALLKLFGTMNAKDPNMVAPSPARRHSQGHAHPPDQ